MKKFYVQSFYLDTDGFLFSQRLKTTSFKVIKADEMIEHEQLKFETQLKCKQFFTVNCCYYANNENLS